MEKEKSLFQRSWAYIWKRNAKEVSRGVLGLIRDRPIASFLSVLALIHFSWVSPFVIIFSFVLNHMFIELFAKLRVVATQFRIIYGYLNIYETSLDRGLKAEKYLVSDYLTWQYDDIDDFLLKKFTGLLGIGTFSINDVVNVFHISSEETISANLTCYTTPPLCSYVFFNEPPTKEMGPFQKFSLLHELGHACLFFVGSSNYTSHCFKLYFVYFLFLGFLLKWGQVPLFVYLSLGVIILLAVGEKIVIWSMQKLNDEIFADSFAIGYLDEEDAKALYVLLNKHVGVFEDGELNGAENEIRLRVLKTNLGLMNDGKDDEVSDTFSRVIKPPFALLGFTCLVVALPAFYSKQLNGHFLLYLGIAAFVSVILFILIHFFIDVLHGVIKKRLEEWGNTVSNR